MTDRAAPSIAEGHSPAVTVSSLSKAYGRVAAVDGISFEVRRGEVFAILGPNGAGKTTTIEILEGYRRPDSGSVSVLGLDPVASGKELKPRIGAMLQEGGLYQTIAPVEVLSLFATFYPNPWNVTELIQVVGLQDAARTRYRGLSGGQKQRLAMALSLVGHPELVFLDEPTAGLDPHARRKAWETIASLRNEGVTILLTTHYLEEAERVADHVAILSGGKLVALGTPGELARRDVTSIRVRTGSSVDLDAWRSLPCVRHATSPEDLTYVLDTGNARSLTVEVATLLRDRDIDLLELRAGSSLEDVYLELTESAADRG